MPPNALTRSAVRPAGPVTQPCVPDGSSLFTTARRSATTVLTLFVSATGTMNCTARPSSDGIGPTTLDVAPDPGACTPFTAPSFVASAEYDARSLFGMVESDCTTTIAGTASESVNRFCQSCTSVDSALAGRKAAWSLLDTPESLPKVGPPTPARTSQIRMSAVGTTIRSQSEGLPDIAPPIS